MSGKLKFPDNCPLSESERAEAMALFVFGCQPTKEQIRWNWKRCFSGLSLVGASGEWHCFDGICAGIYDDGTVEMEDRIVALSNV